MGFAWIYAGTALLWLGILVLYSRRWRRAKTSLDDRIRDLQGQLMQEQFAHNTSDARLSAIRQAAEHSLSDAGSPYRSHVSREDVLRKIIGLVNTAMTENCREVGHFRDLEEATTFINTLPQESNAYCFPLKMWDGDCLHVIYSVPAPTEMPPDGVDVRK